MSELLPRMNQHRSRITSGPSDNVLSLFLKQQKRRKSRNYRGSISDISAFPSYYWLDKGGMMEGKEAPHRTVALIMVAQEQYKKTNKDQDLPHQAGLDGISG